MLLAAVLIFGHSAAWATPGAEAVFVQVQHLVKDGVSYYGNVENSPTDFIHVSRQIRVNAGDVVRLRLTIARGGGIRYWPQANFNIIGRGFTETRRTVRAVDLRADRPGHITRVNFRMTRLESGAPVDGVLAEHAQRGTINLIVERERNALVVEKLYRLGLLREADEGGKRFYAEQLDRGARVEQVLASLLKSQESRIHVVQRIRSLIGLYASNEAVADRRLQDGLIRLLGRVPSVLPLRWDRLVNLMAACQADRYGHSDIACDNVANALVNIPDVRNALNSYFVSGDGPF